MMMMMIIIFSVWMMMITSVWCVGVVPKAAVVQDEVEETSIVVCMRQEIFPEMWFGLVWFGMVLFDMRETGNIS